MFVECVSLRVERAGKSQVIIIQESHVLCGALENADIASARDALVPLQPNMLYARKAATDFGCGVRRSVVYDNNLYIGACGSGAVNCARQHLRPIIGWNNYANSGHAN